MKAKKCKHCQEEIAKNAKICPKCGGRFGLPAFAKIIIIIVIIFACVIGCVKGCSDSVDEVAKSYKDVNGKTSFKINETFQNSYEKITMTEVNTNVKEYSEYFGPKDGYKIIAAKFEVENINNEQDELYVSSLSFNAYADGVAVDSYFYGDDTYNDLSATIGKGKKTVGYVLYEVPKNASEIIIEYCADFWTDGNNIEFVVQ